MPLTYMVANRGTGWRPDWPDERDLLFTPHEGLIFPTQVDMRPLMPPIHDQGAIGSCVAHSTETALRFEHNKQGLGDYDFSRMFIYYEAREIDGDPNADTGTTNRAGMKVLAKKGCVPEPDWPYKEDLLYRHPPALIERKAYGDRILRYQRVARTLYHIKACLQHWPMVFGMSIYSSFETPEAMSTGVVPMPASGELLLGGHSMLIVGYSDGPIVTPAGPVSRTFIFRNSWGSGYGDKGYGYLPYDYLLKRGLSSDFWMLQLAR